MLDSRVLAWKLETRHQLKWAVQESGRKTTAKVDGISERKVDSKMAKGYLLNAEESIEPNNQENGKEKLDSKQLKIKAPLHERWRFKKSLIKNPQFIIKVTHSFNNHPETWKELVGK